MVGGCLPVSQKANVARVSELAGCTQQQPGGDAGEEALLRALILGGDVRDGVGVGVEGGEARQEGGGLRGVGGLGGRVALADGEAGGAHR
eukprot:3910902-Pleurochrysis_carterae.AAC.2